MAQRATLAWVVVAVTVALAIIIGSWHLGDSVIGVAVDAEARLTEFRDITIDQLVTDDTGALDELARDVAVVKAGIEPASGLMRWVRRFSPSVAWLPMADLELRAWTSQMDRVDHDLDAATVLLASSSQLLDLYSDSQTALVATRAGSSVPFLRSQVATLESSYEAGREAIDEAVRAGRTSGVGLLAPRARELTDLLGELERLMSGAADTGAEVSGLLAELLDLAEDAQPLMAQFVIGESEPEQMTSEEIRATLGRMNVHTLEAKKRARSTLDLIAETGQTEALLLRLADLDRVLDVLRSFNDAALVALSVVEPAVSVMEGSGAGLLDSAGALVDMFDAFSERSDEIAQAVAELGAAELTLKELSTGPGDASFASGLADISRFVGDLRSGLDMVNRIAPHGRALLAGDGVRRYLVLGQSSDELRATGGFVSAVWLVTFEDGGLADVKYQDSVRVDDWERLALYPKAPLGLDEHMNAWVWLLRDVSWDPDFPTTAATAEDMYAIGQRQDVDGVVAINQWTLLKLVEALGSIPQPEADEPVTPRNLLGVLEEGTDRYGRAYMDLVLQGVLDRLNQPTSMPTLMRLASALHDTLRKRETLLYFDDPALQALARDLRWDGRVRQDSSDYLYVVDSNVGWNKVDRNIQRDISYLVDLRRGARPRVSLTLGYQNHSGPDSPACEPQWRSRDTDYGAFKNACYWNFLRVYVPQGSTVLSTTPLTLPELSVSVEIGRGAPGQDTGAVSSSHDRLVFSGLATIEAGARGEVTLVYDLPASVVKREDGTITYRLLVQKQPGVRERNLSLDLILPEGFDLVESSHPTVYSSDSRVGLSLVVTEDTLIDLKFRVGTDG
ncbi:MAG: DUF4012 domain-containing protein [Chloroflexi bacterium]|nr:DUF4012 domain-containing protein [Chloroflexota bacterium]